MKTLISQRKYFKTIVLSIIVGAGLYAYSAGAVTMLEQQTNTTVQSQDQPASEPITPAPLDTTPGVATIKSDPRFKDSDQLPAPQPAAPVISPSAAISGQTGISTGFGNTVGNNGDLGDGYTETTTQKDLNGGVTTTKRDVDINDGDARIKTTVKGPDGSVSTTRTKIDAK